MGESIIGQVYSLLCEIKVSGHQDIKRMNAALDILREMSKANEEARKREDRDKQQVVSGELDA